MTNASFVIQGKFYLNSNATRSVFSVSGDREPATANFHLRISRFLLHIWVFEQTQRLARDFSGDVWSDDEDGIFSCRPVFQWRIRGNELAAGWPMRRGWVERICNFTLLFSFPFDSFPYFWVTALLCVWIFFFCCEESLFKFLWICSCAILINSYINWQIEL